MLNRSPLEQQQAMARRIHDVYFSREDGAIITTSHLNDALRDLFPVLQKNVNKALAPLIKLIESLAQHELALYTNGNNLASALPQNHIASRLLNLQTQLQFSKKSFGRYQDALPSNAIKTTALSNLLNVSAETLAEVTTMDYKDAYLLLLRVNACKGTYHFVDSSWRESPLRHLSVIQNKEGDYFKIGAKEVMSLAEFQKQIEKSAAYAMYKYNTQPAHPFHG